MDSTPKMYLVLLFLLGSFVSVSSHSLRIKMTTTGKKIVGKNLIIMCLVTAPPTASVNLLKNGKILKEDSRIILTEETLSGGRTRYEVVIKGLQLSDSGKYQCKVQAGGARSFSTVGITVRDKRRSSQASSSSSSSSSSSISSSSKNSRKSFKERIAWLRRLGLKISKND